MNDSTKTSSTRTSASHKVANDPMATNHGLPNESYSMEQSASSSAAPAASIPGPEDHTELHSFLNTLLGDPAQLDELQQAERDILGTNSRPNSISSSSAQAADSIPLLSPEAMREFHAALQQIPPNDSAALAHVDPDLVWTETPPHRFVWAHDNDIWKATHKLADYWTLRREIFGPQRYGLPMKLVSSKNSPEDSSSFAPSSALDPRVVDAIRMGAYQVLPPDRYGRHVLLTDRQVVSACLFDPQLRQQVYFFLIHCLSESPDCLRNGYGRKL